MFASKLKGQQCIRMTITRLAQLMVDILLNLTSFRLLKQFYKNLESLKSQNRHWKTEVSEFFFSFLKFLDFLDIWLNYWKIANFLSLQKHSVFLISPSLQKSHKMGATTFSMTTLRITTFSITAHSIMGLNLTLSIAKLYIEYQWRSAYWHSA